MCDTARALGIPFMAGSSLPVAFRRPPLQVPLGAGVAEIVAIGYGRLEPYGFHALEMAQCLAERRGGYETGVAAVQCVSGRTFRTRLGPIVRYRLYRSCSPRHAPGVGKGKPVGEETAPDSTGRLGLY